MKKFIIALVACAFSVCIFAQEHSDLTKEQVLAMSVDELSELPLEDLMYAVVLLDVKSVDELFAIIMNKNISSASKKAEDSFKSPLSSSVITRDEMRNYGCTNVEEALRLLPGIISREKTNGSYDIHIRGLDNIPDGNMNMYTENVNTLVMVDGRPVFNYGTGAMFWEALPIGIEDIERIEVVRGASSALYGSNAVTGVINIITEKPTQESKFVSGSFQAGSQNTYVGDIAFRKAFKSGFGFSVSGNYQMRNRPTDQIYIIPDEGVFDSRDESITYEDGGWVSVTDLQYIKKIDALGDVTNMVESSLNVDDIFPKSELARKSLGLNAILHYAPKSDIFVSLSGGYQNSVEMNSVVRYDAFPMAYRTSKEAYVDLSADYKGLGLHLDFISGPMDFMEGATSFKVLNQQFTANLEYDWKVTDDLYIRPGVNYRWNRMDDSDYAGKAQKPILDAFGDTVTLAGFFDGNVTLNAIAPSLRVDYTLLDKLRIIVAYRAEKLSSPDKWYHSFQGLINYAPNDMHDIRLIYSRANRSSIFLNTKGAFDQRRTDYAAPAEASFLGNPDAKVMSCDNFEVGYRVRPVPSLVLDLEGYYNFSRDYGTLMAHESSVLVKAYDLTSILISAMLDFSKMLTLEDDISALAKTATEVQFNNVPYKVQSRGISLGADWIISKQLIARVNLNIQKTTIDHYFHYDHNTDIMSQLLASEDKFSEALTDVIGRVLTAEASGTSVIQMITRDPVTASEIAQYEQGYAAAQVAGTEDVYLDNLFSNSSLDAADRMLYYYYLKYGVNTDGEGHLYVGNSENVDHEDRMNYTHKNTPSFYGSVGLIYKPLDILSFSANGYWMSKQEMSTYAGTVDVKSKFNLSFRAAYKPVEQFEIFFNAHNILNDRTREFAYTDRTAGIYSVGINFKF